MNEVTGPMTFKEAFHRLMAGYPIKRARWLGYWIADNAGNILMYCKDGMVVSMASGCTPAFTLEQTTADDWFVLTDAEKEELDLIRNSGLLSHAADQREAEERLNSNPVVDL